MVVGAVDSRRQSTGDRDISILYFTFLLLSGIIGFSKSVRRAPALNQSTCKQCTTVVLSGDYCTDLTVLKGGYVCEVISHIIWSCAPVFVISIPELTK